MEIRKKNRKRSGMSLRQLFLTYLIKVAVCVVVITIGYVALWAIGIINHLFLPADYYPKKVDQYMESIQKNGTLDMGEIPKEISYAVLDSDKNVLQSTLSNKDRKSAVALLKDSQSETLSQNSNKKQIRILRTSEKTYVFSCYVYAEFSSDVLRSVFPHIERIAIPLYLVLVLGGILAESVKMAKKLSEKIETMKQMADQIKERELEFEISYTGVKELDTVVDSLKDLRDDLKESLQNQWQLQQMQKEQMGALAHDIKTPLTIIRGNAELLAETELEEEQSDYLNSISGNVERIQNYVVDLLEISKGNEFEVKMEQTVIDNFWSEFVEQAKQLCKVKHIQAVLDYHPSGTRMRLDRQQCMRALLNLVDNAVQFSKEGGNIYLASCVEKGIWSVSVEDEGAGFSAEDLKYAKTKFYRAKNERSMDGHYGMGLYIVEQIAKKHHGELVLTNGEKGAKVIFSIG
ncbi:sensor histidine kinase [Roseburia sp. 831b]|uniref:sensor histidine kinase n=1 Tax=Roseburia sp. 831b TaxID=1261635 RepID=UPI000952FD5B|nr:HAMP domain-containing sensor histidine kinase [Roseburia sp. 831b]WVK72084.1 HAMP domain-containing sensor histidine kinase [Roseburia sp. 831b]